MISWLVRFAAFAALVLATGTPLSGQDDDFLYDQALGVGLRSETLYLSPTTAIRTMAPVAYFSGVAGNVMTDVSLSLSWVHENRTYSGRTQRANRLAVRAGFALLFLQERGDKGRTYVGPRVGLGRVGYDSGNLNTDSRYDLSAAFVTGGEYFIVPGMGLGGEVAAEYRTFRPTERDNTTSFGAAELTAELRVRWYLR